MMICSLKWVLIQGRSFCGGKIWLKMAYMSDMFSEAASNNSDPRPVTVIDCLKYLSLFSLSLCYRNQLPSSDCFWPLTYSVRTMEANGSGK